MKKYLALLLAVIFILSFAVAAFAEDKPEITLGGKLVLRGWYFDNVNSSSAPVETESQALYTTNVYLTVDAKINDNVRGFIELETASGTAGSQTSGVYYWGTYDAKPAADILIRQAWIQYTGSGLLGVPAGLKAGHMFLSLGEKIFLDVTRFGTDAIMVWTDPTKELHIGAFTAKLNEGAVKLGDINHKDDIDLYTLLGTYMLDKDNKIGLNYTLVHSDGNAGGAVGAVNKLDFQNAAIHANGNISGFSYAAEVDLQFGTIESLAKKEYDFAGWAGVLKLGYMIDPVNIRASFAMGSGDDENTDDEYSEFQAFVGTDDIGAIARFTHYTIVYERIIRTAATQNARGDIRTTGIANTTYYNLGIDINPMKDLSMSLDGFMLQATETKGIANAYHPTKEVDDNLGWEVDFKASYKIAKNLTYFVEGGYFDSGDFYEDLYGKDKNEGVTQFVHGLKLEF